MGMLDFAWFAANRMPFRWQREAVVACCRYLDAVPEGGGLVQAVMGSGKSVVISELCWLMHQWSPDPHEVIVVTTPTIQLVEQLSTTIAKRLGSENVGQYYTHGHDVRRVTVACTKSVGLLAEALDQQSKACTLWIPDEAHRTEVESVRLAIEALRPGWRIGFTATPFLAESNRALRSFDRVLYEYGLSTALQDRVIVPWKIIPWTGGEKSVDEACLTMISDSVGPGICNASTIDDAENFSRTLCAAGISSAAIHSGLDRAQRVSVVDRIQAGDLRCVVHVAMLTEGVDWPWLQWMALRRPISSRVRFAQEVGRAIRAYPGKVLATIYDPRDLFGEFRLSYEAVVGGGALVPDEESQVHPVERAAQLLTQLATGCEDGADQALRTSRVGRYLRQLSSAVEAEGFIERGVTAGSWRYDLATEKQRTYAMKVGGALKSVDGMPEIHRMALRECYKNLHFLKRGQASDLLTILFGLAKARRWPNLAEQMADP